MINVATVTKALQTLLKNDGDVSSHFKEIARGEFVNQDAHHTPWCGIYRSTVDYDVATLGGGNRSWQGNLTITVIIQDTSMVGGDDAEQNLELSIKKVLDAILTDSNTRSINGNVEFMTNMSIDYSYINENEEETLIFQQAQIDLTFLVRTQ